MNRTFKWINNKPPLKLDKVMTSCSLWSVNPRTPYTTYITVWPICTISTSGERKVNSHGRRAETWKGNCKKWDQLDQEDGDKKRARTEGQRSNIRTVIRSFFFYSAIFSSSFLLFTQPSCCSSNLKLHPSLRLILQQLFTHLKSIFYI